MLVIRGASGANEGVPSAPFSPSDPLLPRPLVGVAVSHFQEPAADGVLEIVCMKNGSAKIKVSAIAGGVQLGEGNNIGGTEITREISIISRGVCSTNGGWF